MQHYLTKWELYVLFVEYLRFQQVNFSPAVYCFKARRQLATLREQSFFNTNPIITKEELKKISRTKNFKGTSLERGNVGVYFKDRKAFAQWLEDYLVDYKADRLHTRRELFSTYRQSMRHTLDLLRSYSNINEKRIKLEPEIDDGEGNILRTNTRTRLYEDILFMIQHEYLSLNDVILLNTNVLTDMESKETPVFSTHLTFLKPIDEIETFVCATGVARRKDTKPKEQDETSNTGIASPYNQFEIKRTNSKDAESEQIWHNNYPLDLKYGTILYNLLRFIIRQAKPVTHTDILKNVTFDFYKGRNLTDYQIEKLAERSLKHYCSRLRQYLEGVEIKNHDHTIYLKEK